MTPVSEGLVAEGRPDIIDRQCSLGCFLVFPPFSRHLFRIGISLYSPAVDFMDRVADVIRPWMRTYQEKSCPNSRRVVFIKDVMPTLDCSQGSDEDPRLGIRQLLHHSPLQLSYY